MSIRLLAIGDMHLGRMPSRLPDALARQPETFSPTSAWERTVLTAIDQEIDLVVIAGDLVDQEDNFFEAYRPLEQGINQLVKAGIKVVGVSGNHDVHVLPRLANQLSAFRLLGGNGQWEQFNFEKEGERLTIHGWSFPKAVVDYNPVTGHQFELQPGINFGLLHCDLDQAQSRYAPVSTASLKQTDLDAWLLGHIHVPSDLSVENRIGYLGSLSGLHVGESGRRGPWLFEIDEGQIRAVTQWQLAPLVWEHIDLDITGLTQPTQAIDHLMTAVRSLSQKWLMSEQAPQAMGLRVSLCGETNQAKAIEEALLDQKPNNLSSGEIDHVFLESIIDQSQVALDLTALAEQPDHIGHLASNLLLLEKPDTNPEKQTLIAQALAQLSEVSQDSRWQLLKSESLTEQDVVSYLKRSGHQLLRELYAQRQERLS